MRVRVIWKNETQETFYVDKVVVIQNDVLVALAPMVSTLYINPNEVRAIAVGENKQ